MIATLDQIASIRENGTPGDAEGNHPLKVPLAVSCPPRTGRRYLDVSLDSDDRYLLTFLRNGRIEHAGARTDSARIGVSRGLTNYTGDIPARARDSASTPSWSPASRATSTTRSDI